jgi:hypothetical protein
MFLRYRRIPGCSFFLGLVLLFFTPTGRDAFATSLIPLTLEEMAQRAEKIFAGVCIAAEQSIDAHGLPVTTVTFAVSEGIKGEVGETVTIRQFDPSRPILARQGLALMLPVRGVPKYVPGEEVILFLGRESRLGLASPMGLSQGKFTVVRTPSGHKMVANSTGNVRLFTPAEAVPPGAREYASFIATVKRLVSAQGQAPDRKSP